MNGRQGKALADTAPRSSRPHRKIRRFRDGWQRGFSKSSLPVGGGIEANSVAERLSVTPYFEDVGTTYKPKKTAEASAEAAYPLGERNALLMALLSKVLLRYFGQKYKNRRCGGERNINQTTAF
ncbi:hypothetical protein [Ruthenibacterium lactatiformans]|uniref:hypothetical protein n=1 Tax=Ruthenibacterium lactatiformans TaxID=1550024 RepID=UPI001111AF20|nr:hypothetical protein [Ruthenibacterium lactatiformans]